MLTFLRNFMYSPEEMGSAGAESATDDVAADEGPTNDALLDSIAANEEVGEETPAKEATAEKPEAEAVEGETEEGAEAPATEEEPVDETDYKTEHGKTSEELAKWKTYAQQLYTERERNAAEKPQAQKPPALDSYLQRYHAGEKPENLELRKLQYRELSNVLLEMAGIDPKAIKQQLDLVPHLYNDVAHARIEAERASTLNLLKESGVAEPRIAKFDGWVAQQLAAGKRMGYVEARERFFGIEGLQQSKAKVSDSAKGRAIKLEAQARMAKNATKRPNPAKTKVDLSKLSDKEWLDMLEKDTQID